MSRVLSWLVIAACAALMAFALAGCGGDDEGDAGGTPPPPAATAEGDGEEEEEGGDGGEAAGIEPVGQEIFSANCAGCHTLQAADASGTTGPNLDELQPDEEQVEEQVRNGGGGMPAFEGKLSDDEIDAVAQFVSESAGG